MLGTSDLTMFVCGNSGAPFGFASTSRRVQVHSPFVSIESQLPSNLAGTSLVALD